MSEDVGLSMAMRWPDRREALRRVPDALLPERLARWQVVLRSEGIDETCITLLDVQQSDCQEEVCLQRQEWLFDEDSRCWVLDRNDEWWMPSAAATKLASLLGA